MDTYRCYYNISQQDIAKSYEIWILEVNLANTWLLLHDTLVLIIDKCIFVLHPCRMNSGNSQWCNVTHTNVLHRSLLF